MQSFKGSVKKTFASHSNSIGGATQCRTDFQTDLTNSPSTTRSFLIGSHFVLSSCSYRDWMGCTQRFRGFAGLPAGLSWQVMEILAWPCRNLSGLMGLTRVDRHCIKRNIHPQTKQKSNCLNLCSKGTLVFAGPFCALHVCLHRAPVFQSQPLEENNCLVLKQWIQSCLLRFRALALRVGGFRACRGACVQLHDRLPLSNLFFALLVRTNQLITNTTSTE